MNLSADNLVLMALQLGDQQNLTLRCYEAWGTEAQIELRSDLDIEIGAVIDCLGQEQKEQPKTIKPHKIVTYKLSRL